MKKTFKIAGIIVAVLTAGFFISGIITPKVNYEGSVTVNKPLEETFTLFNDMEKLSEWIPEIKSYNVISETPDKVGTKIKMMVVSEGNEEEMIETITAFVPNEKVSLRFEVGAMQKSDTYLFSSQGESTVINASHTCEGSNLFFKSLFSFFKSYFRNIDQGYLNNFKTFAEKQ